MLNEQQLLAVNSQSEKIVVIAGAGSGKSTVLLSRIQRLIESGVMPDEMLALTFTNAAAHEMRVRFGEMSLGGCPNFSTFHAFCYSLIAKDFKVAAALGYTKAPYIISEVELKKYKMMTVQMCGTKLSEEKLSNRDLLSERDKFQYDIYWKHLKKLLVKQNLITFDLMCQEICDLFTADDAVIQRYKAQYKYIFVDEFQDTDYVQWGFVSSFGQSSIFVVGDAKQNLYSFRGTSNEIIKSLAEDPNWETIRLGENYRSTTQICEYANKIHKIWGDSPYNLDIHGQCSGCDVVENGWFRLHESEVVDDLLEIAKDVEDYDSIAILCRTNAEVSDVCNLLKSKGIIHSTKSEDSSRHHILKSTIDPSYYVDWLSSMLPSEDFAEYIKLLTVDPTYCEEEKFIQWVGDRFTKYREHVNAIRRILEEEEFAYAKADRIMKYLRIPPAVIDLPSEENCDVIKFVESCISKKSTDCKLYVGTIHSVKGLEYDAVHLIGVNGKYFPTTKNEDHRNLFYVGCTRAKKKLTIWFG